MHGNLQKASKIAQIVFNNQINRCSFVSIRGEMKKQSQFAAANLLSDYVPFLLSQSKT